MTRADWIRLLILSILWGGSFFFVEVALTGLPALTIVWVRVALAAVILAGLLWATGVPFPGRGLWPALLVMGFLNNAVPFTLFVFAQGQITGALASVLNATTPLFTVLVAHVATADERITGTKAAGLGLGFAGVVVMLAAEGLGGEVVAMLACLLAALSYGVASVWGRRFRARGVAPLVTAFGQVASSSLLLLPVWLWVDAPWTMGWPGLRPVAAMVGLAGVSTVLAYVLYFRLLASAGATNLSLVTFLIPVSATAMGWAVLGERLLLQDVAGFALILAGLMAIDGRMVRWLAGR
ncbi:DMT family transporter [Tabrizicola sp.]|uniref:DMT family transporter n=1 Tax=Tabrizicola sp. TaxID=2005166 RepID=UPI00286B5A69|nr:DMT family transporter [Tabrizicola sp.]